MSASIITIPRLHGTSFDWLTWCGGSLNRLGVQYNSCHIEAMRHEIRKYAVGWCEGDGVLCRPKAGQVAVMFLKDGEFWWTHIRRNEFEIVFCDVATCRAVRHALSEKTNPRLAKGGDTT